ncbi:MAG: hypothetical protein KBS76_01595, partial [Ruminococcus sp.]|nr:hypothetical protein [Candidatus Apopatosoma intestinale]
MWLVLSLIANILWSGSDLFSKIGCRHADDRRSHLKMVMAVGTVMGIHALIELLLGKAELSLSVFLTYLPVSLLYISSMTLGYLGLRYIELSVSSPICNSSGAIVAILAIGKVGWHEVGIPTVLASVLVCVGVIGLGFVEVSEDEERREMRQKEGRFSYAKNPLALILPIAYCVLDAAGTYADNRVLEVLDESSANVAYELTFFAAAVVCFIYVVLIRKDRLLPSRELPKLAGAVCETAGQFAYIFAIADTSHLMVSAPIISAYCVTSLLW